MAKCTKQRMIIKRLIFLVGPMLGLGHQLLVLGNWNNNGHRLSVLVANDLPDKCC